MTKKIKYNVVWELFVDESFYGMFCVRPKNDKDFNSPRCFHFVFKDDAENFKILVEKAHCAVPS